MVWSNRQCFLVSVRLGLIAAVVVALYWYVRSLYAPFPDTTGTFFPYSDYPFVLTMSRWSDVLCAPLYVGILVTMYGKYPLIASSSILSGLTSLVIVGLALGLILTLKYGFGIGLMSGLIFGLTGTLLLALFYGFVFVFFWMVRV
jgi:hypothetical protein